MKITISLLLFAWVGLSYAQDASPCNHLHGTHHLVKEAKQDYPAEIRDNIPYPIQKHYLPLCAEKGQDISPPSLSRTSFGPTNVQGNAEGIHAAYITYDESATNVTNYAYGIGTSPGEADIRWWQALNANRKRSGAHSMTELGLNEGDVFYISIYAIYDSGPNSSTESSGPMTFAWEPLGLASYNLSVDYATDGLDASGNIIAGWTPTEVTEFDDFLTKMIPIIKDIYGAPSRDVAVSLVRDLYYTSSNVYFPGDNEVHMSNGLNAQLLTHELIHAMRDNVIVSSTADWKYSSKLSGFEEGFAQGVSYACMQRYADLYPNDPVTTSPLWWSSHAWDYDMRNRAIITTEDFWSASNGSGISWERYEVAAAAMLKAYLEDEDFFSNFNAEYYTRLNNDHALVSSRTLLVDIFSTVLTEVERVPTQEWVDNQRIFDCEIAQGFKVYDNMQHYPYWADYFIFNTIYYYETFSNGSEWAYYDNGLGEYVYYSQNGQSGSGTIKHFDGTTVWNQNFDITPYDNPPVLFDMGEKSLALTTADTQLPWPAGDAADFAFDLNDFGLYELEINFPNASLITHRVMGDEIIGSKDVYGGMLNSSGGEIMIDHIDYPSEAPSPIINGAFLAPKAWAGVPNATTGYDDSVPGEVGVLYVDDNCNKYLSFRNMAYGSTSGNQIFLFDTDDMELIQEEALFTYTEAGLDVSFTDASSVFEHPDYDFQDGAPATWSWDFDDGNTSNLASVIHTYDSEGQYNVCLTVSNGCWSDTYCETVLILFGSNKNINENLEVIFSPNPVKENAVIELPKNNETLILEVYNSLGQQIKKQEGINYFELDASLLSTSGVYFYTLKDEAGIVNYADRFVVAK